MSDIGKGIALMVLVAIAVLFIYCFFFGKCSKNPFGVLTPRPSGSGSGSGSGRRRGGSDNLEAEGSGSGGAGAGGSGSGGGIIAELTSRFKDIDVTKGVSQGQKKSEGGGGCGFWDLGCKLGDAWKNITEGKTIFGAATPFPAIRGAPFLVP
jgi:hypothetical protein